MQLCFTKYIACTVTLLYIWALKWRSLLPIYLWEKAKQKSLAKARPILSLGNDISTTFSPSGIPSREDLTQFIDQANKHHPTIKFTAEISGTETTFLDTSVYKGERFPNESVLDIRTHSNLTETFQYTHFSSCHPQGVKKGFIKGEALRLLRTNSSKKAFEKKNQTLPISSH